MQNAFCKSVIFNKIVKCINNELRKDGGSTEIDYIEQTLWLLFLKYLEDLEFNKKTENESNGKTYNRISDKKYTWVSYVHPPAPVFALLFRHYFLPFFEFVFKTIIVQQL